jgi:hypothetical protein
MGRDRLFRCLPDRLAHWKLTPVTCVVCLLRADACVCVVLSDCRHLYDEWCNSVLGSRWISCSVYRDRGPQVFCHSGTSHRYISTTIVYQNVHLLHTIGMCNSTTALRNR